jgi:ribosomal protein S18 acetylase RimI-like enzyme
MQNLLAERRQTIALEVAATNQQALGLYRGRGFAIVTAYDYYRLPVTQTEAEIA